MNLYIKIENNQPVGFPIVEENLKMLHVDVANLPSEYAVYNKTESPIAGPYETLSMELVLESGGVTEVYHVNAMTEEERLAKQEQVNAGGSPKGWIFDEVTCSFAPPVPMPEGAHIWDNETEQWVGIAGAANV
jgi:hypothetical protein